jgi:hypothetical protein
MRSHAVCVSVNPRTNFWTLELIFMKSGTHIMAPVPISTAYLRDPSHQFLCLYVYPSIVVRQRLGKNVTAAMYTHATIEELLDAWFSMLSVSYQWEVGD